MNLSKLPLSHVHRLSESCKEAKEFLLSCLTNGGFVSNRYRKEEKEHLHKRVRELTSEGLDKKTIAMRLSTTVSQVTKIRTLLNKEGKDAGQKD